MALKIKFTSTYSETDFQGNTKTQVNSFEASGSLKEVGTFTFNLLERVQLPGVMPILVSNQTNQHLRIEDPLSQLYLPPSPRQKR